jgi:hypothetical protein
MSGPSEIHWNGKPVGIFEPYTADLAGIGGTWKATTTKAAEDFLKALRWKPDPAVPVALFLSGIEDEVCVDVQESPPRRILVHSLQRVGAEPWFMVLLPLPEQKK